MDIFAPTAVEHVQALGTSLAVGLLIGLERERKPDAKAGLRTFGLVGMLGCISALVAERGGASWILAAGLLTVGVMMIVAHSKEPQGDGDPGTTSVVALMVCYGLGAAVWYGYATLAVMAGIATTVLLYFKAELHGMTARLTRKDLISILQFAALSFIVLPILPDDDYGPYRAFNPHQIWWMVVLIAGLSLAGYAALRVAGARLGAAAIGLFGGLASSTATTLVFARNARQQQNLLGLAAVTILLANIMVPLRLVVEAVAVAPTIVAPLAVVLCSGLVLGLLAALPGWRQLVSRDDLPMPEVTNPTEIGTALSFGAIYAFVLFACAWLEDLAGSKGLYFVALVSGLTDVDAITLSTLRLYNLDKLPQFQAVATIALANLANLSFKAGLVLVIGGKTLARRTLPGLVAIGVGMGGSLFFLASSAAAAA
ncbi:MAG TPA: MgtC/SapB family protein [Rhodocyclaceae bacterium]|nr:MgtC/SapB family protein [Rhodocyclaceae bacterium]